MKGLEAFILIGGRSTRFGTDKAFARLDGETLAARSVRLLQAALEPSRLSFIAAAKDQFPAGLATDPGVGVLADIKPGFGAWSGLHAALANATSDRIFVLACDLPFVSAELVHLILLADSDEMEAVVPLQPDGRLQPLCALYRVQPCRAAIEDILADPQDLPPVASLFDRLRSRIVHYEEYADFPNASRFFHNINTPDDLASASLE